jgi:hypothetical protein
MARTRKRLDALVADVVSIAVCSEFLQKQRQTIGIVRIKTICVTKIPIKAQPVGVKK